MICQISDVNNQLSKNTKIRIFHTKSVLLYGSETWLVSQGLTRKVETFINHCLDKFINNKLRVNYR